MGWGSPTMGGGGLAKTNFVLPNKRSHTHPYCHLPIALAIPLALQLPPTH